MKAVVITEAGGPEVLAVKDIPEPTPEKGEIRVRVKATAVNRADVMQRAGQYPPPSDVSQDVPGLEFAGVVDAIGHGVTEVNEGDRVCGLAGGGTYAEYLVVQARTVAHIPEDITFNEAAALPEAYITAYDAMVLQAKLSAGQIVLISAVGSGVGTAAVQIARAIGARSIGTARTEDKLERARALGMDYSLLVTDGKFASQVLSHTDALGADVVLELVGGAYIAEDVKCTRTRGRIMIVGLVAGNKCDINFGLVLKNRITIKGTTLRRRPLEEKIAAGQCLARNIMPLVETGQLQPVIDCVFPLDAAADAHQHMESNENFGKIILEVE
jgi:putative PIG3 family NAD(P)H quinone oxidoreductase